MSPPKVLIPKESTKVCFKDYDPNELSCEECEDMALCKKKTPVRVKR